MSIEWHFAASGILGVQGTYSKSFVELKHVDIGHGQPSLLQHFGRSVRWTDEELRNRSLA